MNNLNSSIGPQPGSSGVATGEYPWEVKPIAFRLAAGFLLVNTVLSLLTLFLGQAPNVISSVVDIALMIGLWGLRPGARSFTLFRAYAGAVIMSILAFLQYDMLTAVIITVIQLAYSGSLVLLLQGETRNWKIYTALGVFVVLVFGITCILSLLTLLAKLVA